MFAIIHINYQLFIIAFYQVEINYGYVGWLIFPTF